MVSIPQFGKALISPSTHVYFHPTSLHFTPPLGAWSLFVFRSNPTITSNDSSVGLPSLRRQTVLNCA